MASFILGSMWFCLVSVSTASGIYGGGDGTEQNPYQLWSVEHLVALGNRPEDYDQSFILMADIDLSEYVYDDSIIAPDKDRETRGFQGNSFEGTFDGNSFVIRNLTIVNPSVHHLGLIGQIGPGGLVRNLHLKGVQIVGDVGVAGLADVNRGTISNCSVEGRIEGRYYVGGLVAFNDSGTIEDSSVLVLIEQKKIGSLYGGLFAACEGGIVRRCQAISTLVLEQPGSIVGGFAAANIKGTIEQCFSSSTIRSTQQNFSSVGGFCGINEGVIRSCAALLTTIYVPGKGIGGLIGENHSTVVSCYVDGKVFGKIDTGGIVGVNTGYIVDSYADVAVCGQGDIGGFSGTNLYGIARSFSLGSVTALDGPAGGFVGRNTGRIVNSFWNTDTSGTFQSPAGQPLTTAQMRYPATFQGWGDDRWVIDAGLDHPRLEWEDTEGTLLQDLRAVYGGGSGTAEDPYWITSIEELSAIGQYAQDLNKSFKLMTDLDFQDTEFGGIAVGKGFDGTFDGNGKVLSNLVLLGNDQYTGVFPYIQNNGVVRNLGLQSVRITGSQNIGALAGKNEGLIDRCAVENAVILCPESNPAYKVGGLAGQNSGVIRDSVCAVKMVIEALDSKSFGGLVGYNNGRIERSSATGSIESLGRNSSFFGGFVGLAGYMSIIQDCLSEVDLISLGADSFYFGGFCGVQNFRTRIENSVSIGRFVADPSNRTFGGFVGANGRDLLYGGTTLTGCFWDIETSGIMHGIGENNSPPNEATGATTEMLQRAQTYLDAGWSDQDAEGVAVWQLRDGAYPMLPTVVQEEHD